MNKETDNTFSGENNGRGFKVGCMIGACCLQCRPEVAESEYEEYETRTFWTRSPLRRFVSFSTNSRFVQIMSPQLKILLLGRGRRRKSLN